MRSCDKLLPIATWYEKIRGPLIGFRLDVGGLLIRFRPIDENVLFAMQEDMGGLVKQAEHR